MAGTLTKTTESGAFIRTTWRKDGKRRQKTKQFKKNDEKVVLGYLGEFEVYVYPYNFPDTVFIGEFPVSTQIDRACAPAVLSVYNKIRWFLKGNWQTEPKRRKGANARRRACILAYNSGLDKLKKTGKRSV